MDQDRIEKIYNTLEGFVIELDPDPVVRGPAYLQDLISKTRGYLNTVSMFTQEVHRETHHLESQLDARQSAFDIQADELLSNDNRVRNLPAVEDRLAMINLLLSEDRRAIETLKREIKSLGHVAKAIRHRQRELSATMSAIRLQNTLIQAELRTGSFYGDENNASRGNAWGKGGPITEDIDANELDGIFDDASKELDDEDVSDDESEVVEEIIEDVDLEEGDPSAPWEMDLGAGDDEEEEEPESEPEEEPESEEPEETETGLSLAEDLLVETSSEEPAEEPIEELGELVEEEEEDPAIAAFLGDSDEDDLSDIFSSL